MPPARPPCRRNGAWKSGNGSGTTAAARAVRAPFSTLDPSLRHFRTTDCGTHGRVEMEMGFRLPPGMTPQAVAAALRDRLAPEEDWETTFHGGERPWRSGKSNPLVRTFLAAIRRAGGTPRFVVKTGTSDMNVVGPAWPETPIVAYGPGDSALDHTPEEHIDLAEFRRSLAVLTDLLGALPGGMG